MARVGPPPKVGPAPIDGRRARSERTRAAVVDALLALLEAGDLRPSADRVAERAGISRRLVFHHFHDLDDLLEAAATRQMERIAPLLVPPPLDGPREERVRGLAELCGRLYERVAPVRRAGLLVEPGSPVVAARLRDARERHRALVEAVLAPEIAAVGPDRRAVFARELAAACSFSAWNELVLQGLSAAEAAAALGRALGALCASAPR